MDASWDFRSHASKDRILDVMRREFDDFVELASDPVGWLRPTACAGWQVRDMVGHVVDVTGGFLDGFDAARQARAVRSIGFAEMASAYDRAARSYREVPLDGLITRLREDTERLMGEFDSLTSDDWSELIVPDRYAGPLPAMAIAASVLGGLTVHGWDIRQGAGETHSVSADAADLLVPFVFALWTVTADAAQVERPFLIGIRTTGHNGGDTRAHVSPDGIRFEAGGLESCEAVLETDPGTLVLMGFGRVNAGTVHGDRQLISRFRSLFRPI